MRDETHRLADPGWWLLIGIATGIGVAFLATLISGFSSSEQRATDEVQYQVYGWPVDWRSTAPDSILDSDSDKACGYGTLGVSLCYFAISAFGWTLLLSPAMPVVTLFGWLYGSRRFGRAPPTPTQPLA